MHHTIHSVRVSRRVLFYFFDFYCELLVGADETALVDMVHHHELCTITTVE